MNWKDLFKRFYTNNEKNYIKAGYGSIASLNARKRTLKRLLRFKYNTCIELGCGWGAMYDVTNKNYIGVDFLLDALKDFKKYKKSTKLICADVQYLPIKIQFDLALAIELTQYVDHKKFFLELSRILKKNSIAILIMPNPEFITWKKRRKISKLNFISINGLKKMLTETGFNILRISHVNFFEYLFSIPDFLVKILDPFSKYIGKSIAVVIKK